MGLSILCNEITNFLIKNKNSKISGRVAAAELLSLAQNFTILHLKASAFARNKD